MTRDDDTPTDGHHARSISGTCDTACRANKTSPATITHYVHYVIYNVAYFSLYIYCVVKYRMKAKYTALSQTTPFFSRVAKQSI